MRSAKERMMLLHEREEQLRRQREKNILTLSGSLSMGLFVLLAALTMRYAGPAYSVSGDLFTGSSLLGENVGGYVLVAVIAFTAGVVLTAVIRHLRKR